MKKKENLFVGHWFTDDLNQNEDPGAPEEQRIIITENEVSFPNGGGNFANGAYDIVNDKIHFKEDD